MSDEDAGLRIHEAHKLALFEVLHAIRDPIITKATAVFWAMLRKQKRAVVKKLSTLKLAEASRADLEKIGDAIDSIPSLPEIGSSAAVKQLITKALVSGAGQTGHVIGIMFGETSQFVKDYVEARSLEKIGADVDATTADQIRSILTDGVNDGTPLSKIITNIKQAGTFSRKRAETIAVTEIGNAYSQGTLDSAKSMVTEDRDMEKAWLAEGDCCDECDGNVEDGWIDIDEDFSSGDDAPLAHPNCRCALMTRVAPQ